MTRSTLLACVLILLVGLAVGLSCADGMDMGWEDDLARVQRLSECR